jgi:hypothetical protein
MRKGGGDNPSKARPNVVGIVYLGLFLGFMLIAFDYRASSTSNTFDIISYIPDHFPLVPLKLFRLCYPTHYDQLDC